MRFFEDFTSWGRALFALFRGFHVLGASTFCTFLRILGPGGEPFLHFFEDFTSWGRALFGTFGGFQVLGASTFWDFFEDFSLEGGGVVFRVSVMRF